MDWTLADAIAKTDKLPPNLKKELRGMIPTYKGYAIRVKKQAEAEVTRALNPEVAEELGPSLGMKPSSSWLIRNIPRQATRAGIIQTFAASHGQWTGWKTLPRKIHGQPRGTTVDWIVDAESEPPKKAVTLNRACIMIERFIEKPKVPPRAAAWFRNTATDPVRQRLVKEGALWADLSENCAQEEKEEEERQRGAAGDGADEKDDFQMAGSFNITNTPTIDPQTYVNDAGGKGGRFRTSQTGPYATGKGMDSGGKAKGGGDAWMNEQPTPQPPHPSGQQNDEQGKGDPMLAELIAHLKEESAKKDAMIAELQRANATLQETVNTMSAQMIQMQATLAQMQQAATAQGAAAMQG